MKNIHFKIITKTIYNFVSIASILLPKQKRTKVKHYLLTYPFCECFVVISAIELLKILKQLLSGLIIQTLLSVSSNSERPNRNNV